MDWLFDLISVVFVGLDIVELTSTLAAELSPPNFEAAPEVIPAVVPALEVVRT